MGATGFGNYERRKKVHAPSAWLPEKEVCLTIFIQKSLSLLVQSFVTWRKFMNGTRISVDHDVFVITDTIDTLFIQLHTRDNCLSRIVHHGIVNNSSCVYAGCAIKVSGFSRKLFIDANISKIFCEEIFESVFSAYKICNVINHNHLEYSRVRWNFFRIAFNSNCTFSRKRALELAFWFSKNFDRYRRDVIVVFRFSKR